MSWLRVWRLLAQVFLPVRRFLMFFLTGRTELERILANRTLSYPCRVHQVENAIRFTSSKSLDRDIHQAQVEKTKSLVHNQIYAVIHKLELYQILVKQIEDIRTTKVTSTDDEHVKLFHTIWSRLVTQAADDHEPMAMISKRWTAIGFQVGPRECRTHRCHDRSILLGLQSIDGLSRYGSSRPSMHRTFIARPRDVLDLREHSIAERLLVRHRCDQHRLLAGAPARDRRARASPSDSLLHSSVQYRRVLPALLARFPRMESVLARATSNDHAVRAAIQTFPRSDAARLSTQSTDTATFLETRFDAIVIEG